jgi:cytochrome P450
MTANAAAAARAPREKEIDVDPEIRRTIGDPAAPAGVPANVTPSAEMPGRVGFLEGMRSLYGMLVHGIAFEDGLRKRHGDFYRSMFIDTPVVVVWDADEIHRILRNDGDAWSAAMGWDTLMFRGLERGGRNTGTLLSLDFDDHRVARKLVQPAFTTKAIEGYIAIGARGFDRTIPGWVARGRVDFKPEVRALLAQVSGEIFTGVADPANAKVLDRALTDFWNGMMAISHDARFSRTWRKSQRGFELLKKTFLDLVPERRRAGGADLFSRMCSGGDEDGLGDEALVRVFLTIMFGAFDTTSAAITSMAYLLAKHPEWQERLRTEAKTVDASRLDVAAMRTMKSIDLVWKETLRLMPVAGFVPRRALRDVQVGRYELRAGTFVVPLMGGIGRHPTWWKDPMKFDPERFSPERAEDKQHAALSMPFGAGAHACVGMQLSSVEMKLFWHRMLTSCRFTLAKDYDARHTFTPMGSVSGKVALALTPL